MHPNDLHLYKEFVPKEERIKLLKRTTFYVWFSMFAVTSIILLIFWLAEHPIHPPEDAMWNEILQGLLIVAALTLATLMPIAPYEYYKKLKKHYKPFDPLKVRTTPRKNNLLYFQGNFADINLIPPTKIVNTEFITIVNDLKAWERFRKTRLIIAGIMGFFIGIAILVSADMMIDENIWINPVYVFFVRTLLLLTTTFIGIFLLMIYGSFLNNIETEIDHYQEQIIEYLHKLFEANGVDLNTLEYPLNAYNIDYYKSNTIINGKPATITCVHVSHNVWEVIAMTNEPLEEFVSHK